MWRIYLSVFVLLYVCNGISCYLTIGWIDTDRLKTSKCEPGWNLTVTTPVNYIKIFSETEAEDITDPCYCELYSPSNNMSALDEAVMNVSTFIGDNYTTLLQGIDGWDKDQSGSLFIETSPGGDPYLIFPHVNKNVSLNSSLYINIKNVAVLMRCSTEAIFIPVSPPVETIEVNATTANNTILAAKWYQESHILIIGVVAVVTLLILLFCLVIICIRKRRNKDKCITVDEKDWKHSTLVAPTNNGSNARAASFEEIDTFIDENEGDDSETAIVVSDSFKKSFKGKTNKKSDSTQNQSGTKEDIYKPESITGNTLPFPTKSEPPDVVKRGIYDNIDKPKVKQAESSDSYVQAGEGPSKDAKDESDKLDSDSFKGISEIPEYAEIEEMQMLIRNQAANKTGTNASTATNTSGSSKCEQKGTTKKKKWKFWNSSDKNKTPSSRSLPKTPQPKTGDISLTNLDFSQLKDAIDKMEPDQVKEKMKQVADITTQKDAGHPEPIYCNDPVPCSSSVPSTNKPTLPKDSADIPKYDSPKSSQVMNEHDKLPESDLVKSSRVKTEPEQSKLTAEPIGSKSKWNFVDPPNKYLSTLNRVNDSPFLKKDALLKDTNSPKSKGVSSQAKVHTPPIQQDTPLTDSSSHRKQSETPINEVVSSRGKWDSPLKIDSRNKLDHPIKTAALPSKWGAPLKDPKPQTSADSPALNAKPSSPRSKWDSPVPPLSLKTDIEPPSLNQRPESPRSKWGAPVDVSLLYAQPEKPSRLPRPTSPGPTANVSLVPLQTHHKPPQSSYHVPKSPTSAFNPPAARTAFSNYHAPKSPTSPTTQGPGAFSRPSVLSSRSLASQTPARKSSFPVQNSSAVNSRPPNGRTSAFPVLGLSKDSDIPNQRQPSFISSRKY